MKIFVCILIVAFVAWYSYSLWHDGYMDGVMEERRKRIRTEVDLLQKELNDIKKKMPLTFDHEHADEPIGKVVYSEECDGGLKFRIIEEVEDD